MDYFINYENQTRKHTHNKNISSLGRKSGDAINRYCLCLLFQVPDTPVGFSVCERPQVF
jgi:hypothetical protein